MWSVLAAVFRFFFALRYRVQIKGDFAALKKLRGNAKGILFLPNHPAHLDPVFVFLFFWPHFKMRPLVIEHIYRMPLLKLVMKIVKGLPIPSFDTVNEFKIRRAQKALQTIADGLNRGQNFILYPAGRLKLTGREALGGSSGAHALIQECPGIHLVLVRTTGFWGSSFSRALTGHSPEIPKTIWQGIKILFKNGIFFAPRRSLQIEWTIDPQDFPRQASRVECNRYLENWYNQYPDGKGNRVEVEPLQLVSSAFWKKDLPQVAKLKKQSSLTGEVEVAPETKEKIYAEIRRLVDQPSLEVTPDMDLALDVGMDSLNLADLIAFLAREFDVEDLHPEEIQKVQHALEVAEGARRSPRKGVHISPFSWPKEAKRPQPALPIGASLPEAFFNSCNRMGSSSACGDDLIGVLTYRSLRRAVVVLAQFFRAFPEEKIGVMLPASVGAYIVILALQCARKVPVMLNWTLGPRYLDEMMKLSEAKRVISSWRFLERLSHVEFGSLVDHIELLEDIRENLPLSLKLKGLFLSSMPRSFLLRAFKLHEVKEEDPCVILFTSGTEAMPKGVPLSHRNILANQRSAMQCIHLNERTVLYGILPPFHSFGFSVAGIFPILGGIKVAFYPDPTDSFALAEGIERWKVTLFCGAPSFTKGLLNAAKKGQLRSVEMFVSGAEKAAPELYERVAALGTGAKLVEGYGITECSPILSLNRLNLPPKGVGQILPDLEVCTIHPETLQPLPKGAEGEICVRGPNVFAGYLGHPRDPFIELQGKRWYRTGDIGKLEEDGTLLLSGRLKRFTKIGGEMISLGAVEQALVDALLAEGRISPDVPSLALCADERTLGKVVLILFSVIALEKEEVNKILQKAGFSRLVKIHAVEKIKEIPMMGTGKTDYRHLQSLIK